MVNALKLGLTYCIEAYALCLSLIEVCFKARAIKGLSLSIKTFFGLDLILLGFLGVIQVNLLTKLSKKDIIRVTNIYYDALDAPKRGEPKV